jgi:hypothetical protein
MHHLGDLAMLVMAERRALAGGADRDQAVEPSAICQSTKARKRRFVELAARTASPER